MAMGTDSGVRGSTGGGDDRSNSERAIGLDPYDIANIYVVRIADDGTSYIDDLTGAFAKHLRAVLVAHIHSAARAAAEHDRTGASAWRIRGDKAGAPEWEAKAAQGYCQNYYDHLGKYHDSYHDNSGNVNDGA